MKFKPHNPFKSYGKTLLVDQNVYLPYTELAERIASESGVVVESKFWDIVLRHLTRIVFALLAVLLTIAFYYNDGFWRQAGFFIILNAVFQYNVTAYWDLVRRFGLKALVRELKSLPADELDHELQYYLTSAEYELLWVDTVEEKIEDTPVEVVDVPVVKTQRPPKRAKRFKRVKRRVVSGRKKKHMKTNLSQTQLNPTRKSSIETRFMLEEFGNIRPGENGMPKSGKKEETHENKSKSNRTKSDTNVTKKSNKKRNNRKK